MANIGSNETVIKYPDVKSDFFEATRPKTAWWNVAVALFAFLAMAILSVIVVQKGFVVLAYEKRPDNFLLFFFGVLVLLLLGLVLLAFFMIRASSSRSSELNERENKKLTFRLKMMETVFELENRKIIIEKQEEEKRIAREEKEYLYSLDEKLRTAEHNRKMQLRKYEFMENYMKYKIELTKIIEEKKDTNSSQKDGIDPAQNAVSDK